MNPDSATNTIAVELHDIRFTYDSGATWALDGVNPVSYTHLTLPTIYSV